jgi:peptidylprolyl isomerase
MADAKRDRQRLARQAKIEAELAARKRAARQRRLIVGGAGFVLLAAIVLIVNRDDDDGATVSAGSTTTSVAATPFPSTSAPPAALESAAGKPCVARTAPLPTGAPEVDVVVGPPPTALVSKDITVGAGGPVPDKAVVTVNYIGVSCSSGLIFDSSYSRNQPATFPLADVIPGWQQGIPGMNIGGKRLLGIPPDLAYRDQSRPPSIAPQETLWFVIELLDAKTAP